MYKKGTYRLSLGIDEDVKEKLDKVVSVSGVSISDAVRLCINCGFDYYCKPVSAETALKQIQELKNELSDVLGCLRS